MKRLLLATATALVLTGAAHAKNGYPYMGTGTQSCADFAQQYRRNPFAVNLAYFDWAQGYMSAMNYAMKLAGQQQKNLNAVPLNDQEYLLRRYCDQHPLASYVEGIFPLYETFPDLPKDEQDTHD